jgi:predicted extracellular nuclease
VLVAGDFNEFAWVGPLVNFTASGLVDLDAAVNIDPVERYSYTYDMNAQQLDHFYVSSVLARGASISKKKKKQLASSTTFFEHVHLSSWQNAKGEVSDHDPAVAKFSLCN